MVGRIGQTVGFTLIPNIILWLPLYLVGEHRGQYTPHMQIHTFNKNNHILFLTSLFLSFFCFSYTYYTYNTYEEKKNMSDTSKEEMQADGVGAESTGHVRLGQDSPFVGGGGYQDEEKYGEESQSHQQPGHHDDEKTICSSRRSRCTWFWVGLALDRYCSPGTGLYHKDFSNPVSIATTVIPKIIHFLHPDDEPTDVMVEDGLLLLVEQRPLEPWGSRDLQLNMVWQLERKRSAHSLRRQCQTGFGRDDAPYGNIFSSARICPATSDAPNQMEEYGASTSHTLCGPWDMLGNVVDPSSASEYDMVD